MVHKIMIARKSLFVVGSQFFMRFLGWIGLVILAKLWGNFAPEALGTIGFAMAFVVLFTFIGDLGFSSAHVKRISEGKDLGICIGTFIVVKLLFTGLMALILFLIIYVYGYTMTTSIILLFIIYYSLSNFAQIPIYTFQAKKEVVKRQIVIVTENLVKVPLFIFVAIIGSGIIENKVTYENLIQLLSLTYVFGILSSFIVGFWLLRKYPIKRPSFKSFKNYFKFALPIMVLLLISSLSVNTDKVMIGYFWDNMEVGYYFTLQQITQVILIVSSALSIVLFPTLSEYHSKSNHKQIKDTVLLAERYISMLTIPIVVSVIVFVKPVINIMLSNAFIPASSVLIMLCILCFVTGLMVPYICLISGIDKPSVAAKVGVIMCSSNVILNLLFIPENGLLVSLNINGALGAAFATVISSFIGLITIKLYSKKLTGIPIFNKDINFHIVAGVIMGLTLLTFNYFLDIQKWHTVTVFVCFGTIIYFIVLTAFNAFDRKDLDFFLSMLHPKEMYKYMTGELKKK